MLDKSLAALPARKAWAPLHLGQLLSSITALLLDLSYVNLGWQPGRAFLISHSGLVASWHPFHLTTFRKRPHHLSRVLPTPVFHCCGNTGLL